jgi:hypothetical protein
MTSEVQQAGQAVPQMPTPQREHELLQRLVGEWTFESDMDMGDGQPPMHTSGTHVVRSIGGFWVIVEGHEQQSDGDDHHMIITYGYDPDRGRYVGSFISSMGSRMWVYDGEMDAQGKMLSLYADGPDWSGDASKLVPYRDAVLFNDDGSWTMTSAVKEDSGNWRQFMEMRCRRR